MQHSTRMALSIAHTSAKGSLFPQSWCTCSPPNFSRYRIILLGVRGECEKIAYNVSARSGVPARIRTRVDAGTPV